MDGAFRLALERRNCRLFVAGQLVSLVGTWTQSVAQSWLVYRLTGSAFWLGVASFCHDDPGVRPGFHVHVASKAPWYEITDELPRFDELPPSFIKGRSPPIVGSR